MTSIDATSARPSGKARAERATARLRDKLFRAARRHTLIVRSLRFLLPLAILGGFGAYGLILKTAFGVGGGGQLRPGKIEITSSDLKMKNPSYFGVTKDGGKYEVRAREAAVDLAMTGPVKLEGIEGDLLQANGVKTRLKATRGALENKKGELELFDGVDVDASNGMRTQLERAMIYTKEHRVVSRDPVRAEMPTGTLTANAMDFSTDKRVGQFRGNVTLRLTQTPSSATGARPSIGLGGDGRQPVDIRAQEFDIDDLKSMADFRGQVVARQGETQLTAPELHVTYEGQASAQAGFDGTPAPPLAPASAGAAPAASSGAQMSRLIARTGVVLTAGTDRRVTAEIVDFDVKADTALFTGNVELLQAKNVFRGGRLAVDRKAGKSRLDTPATTAKGQIGRIAATLIQSPDPAKAATATKTKSATPVDANPFGGLRGDPGAPTDIEADSLEVNDLTKQASFRGRVVAKQGDQIIQTAELVAHYAGQTGLMSGAGAEAATKEATAKGLGGAQLTHIETKGVTKITTKDGQEADGGNARFDLKANQITMDGLNGVVTLRQGQGSKVDGCKLQMNLTTGEAHVLPCAAATNAVIPPTAAQLNIAAKPGVAPPTQPTDCPPGRMCVIIQRPDQLKQAAEARSKATGVPAGGGNVPAAKAAPARPKTEPVQPQTSPSTVYRSN